MVVGALRLTIHKHPTNHIILIAFLPKLFGIKSTNILDNSLDKETNFI